MLCSKCCGNYSRTEAKYSRAEITSKNTISFLVNLIELFQSLPRNYLKILRGMATAATQRPRGDTFDKIQSPFREHQEFLLFPWGIEERSVRTFWPDLIASAETIYIVSLCRTVVRSYIRTFLRRRSSLFFYPVIYGEKLQKKDKSRPKIQVILSNSSRKTFVKS